MTTTSVTHRPTFAVVGNWPDSAIRALADLLLDVAEQERRRDAERGESPKTAEVESQSPSPVLDLPLAAGIE